MIPEPGRALTDLAMRLLLTIAPQTANTFAAADSLLVGQLMLTLSQEFERAIATRMQDIDELRELLAHAPVSHASSLPARAQFATATPASLHLRDVNQLHDEGMRLLIELHSEVELTDADLNLRIWHFLRAHSERHKFD